MTPPPHACGHTTCAVPLEIHLNDGLTANARRALTANRTVLLDFNDIAWPERWRHAGSQTAYARGEREEHPCWECPGVQKLGRRVIRQLAATEAQDRRLVVRGVAPGICWDPGHLERKNPDGMTHWDISSILDFAEWSRRQLGPGWTVQAEPAGFHELPSLTGLFGPNGFED